MMSPHELFPHQETQWQVDHFDFNEETEQQKNEDSFLKLEQQLQQEESNLPKPEDAIF